MLERMDKTLVAIDSKLDAHLDAYRLYTAHNDTWRDTINKAFVTIMVGTVGALVLAACTYLGKQVTPLPYEVTTPPQEASQVGAPVTLPDTPKNATQTATALPSPTVEPTITPSPLPTYSPATANPAIVEVTAADRAALARLCWVEVRGFKAAPRRDACLSIISTVLLRAYKRDMSDGTIMGTLTWGCKRGQDWCQFPAYVAYGGCDGIIPNKCPDNDPVGVAIFEPIVSAYFDRAERGTCDGYLFYWERTASWCEISDGVSSMRFWAPATPVVLPTSTK